jgi:hypothetical protein
MTGLFPQLVLYGLAAAFAAPIAAVVCAFVLGKSSRPLPSAIAFVLGAVLLDAVVTVIIVIALGRADASTDIGAYIDLALGAIFLILGAVAVVQKETPEGEAKQRARVERLAGAGPWTLISAGFAVQVINLDAIAVMAAGLKEIVLGGTTGFAALIAVLFLLALMLLPYYAPAVFFALRPGSARPALVRMTDWIVANARLLEILTGFGFGIIFAVKGYRALV